MLRCVGIGIVSNQIDNTFPSTTPSFFTLHVTSNAAISLNPERKFSLLVIDCSRLCNNFHFSLNFHINIFSPDDNFCSSEENLLISMRRKVYKLTISQAKNFGPIICSVLYGILLNCSFTLRSNSRTAVSNSTRVKARLHSNFCQGDFTNHKPLFSVK